MRTCLLILVFFCTHLQAQQLIETRPLITVTGEAVQKVIPDEIIIHYTYSQNLESQSIGSSSFSEQDWLKQNFRFVGVPDEDISVGLEVLRTNSKQSYTVIKDYYFTLKDVKKYRDVLIQLIKIDKGEITGIEFRTTKLDENKELARKQAIAAARSKAQILAAELEQSIGKAFIIIDESVAIVNYYDKPSIESYRRTKEINDIYIDFPGYISIPAKVKVSFELNL